MPNEVRLQFKQLADECELLALNLNQSANAEQRLRWLAEMKVILANMDELIDAQRPYLSQRNASTIALQPCPTSDAASEVTMIPQSDGSVIRCQAP